MRAEHVTICTLYAITYPHMLRRWLHVPVHLSMKTIHWQQQCLHSDIIPDDNKIKVPNTSLASVCTKENTEIEN